MSRKFLRHCPICLQKARLVEDHDHISGRVRGSICGRCNSALGYFKDSHALLLESAQQCGIGAPYRGMAWFPNVGVLSRAAAYLLDEQGLPYSRI